MDRDSSHGYRAFGLNIRSSLDLPGLPAAPDGEFDVEIKDAPIPPTLPGAADTGLRYQAAPGRLLLVVDRIARFLISSGSEILIDREPGADDDAARHFLLGPAFRGLLQQREELVLRGSAIDVRGRGIVFLGHSGAGKSTLAAAFARNGYRFLTDELCVVRPGPEAPRMIFPGIPQAQLWRDSLTKLGIPPASLKRVRRGLQKRILPVADGFTDVPLPIGKVYFLNPIATSAIKLTAIDSAAAYGILDKPPVRGPYLKGLGAEPIHRQLAMTLTLDIPVVLVERPRRKFQLAEMMQLLEADFPK